MLDLLFADLPCEQVMLNTRPDAKPAATAYRTWGFHAIGDNTSWPGVAPRQFLLKELAGNPDSGDPPSAPVPGADGFR
jgi:hypothetical protein